MEKAMETDHATEGFAEALRAAREAKGLSQRALGERAGAPQSHISKVENGLVDLRVSSLVAIARAVDLELVLVPRRSIPAVDSIARSFADDAARSGKTARRALRELTRLHDSLEALARRAAPDGEPGDSLDDAAHAAANGAAYGAAPDGELREAPAPPPYPALAGGELAGFLRTARELRAFALEPAELRTVRNANRALAAYARGAGGVVAVRSALSRLQDLRLALAKGRSAEELGIQIPAWSLTEDDDDD